MHRFSGIIGILIFLLVAYLLSNNRKKIPYKTVIFGLVTQFVIALFMLKTPVGVKIFDWVNSAFVKVLGYSDKGSKFLFGSLVDSQDIGASLAFQVLPLIIFVSALMGILVYLGVIQFLVKLLARVFYKALKITGVEAFISSLLIFMGIESITGVKEYIRKMNDSRVFTIMTTFMATIAGSVMLAYMSFGAKAGHLLTASLMSAPAAILISKIMIPDTETGETDPLEKIQMEQKEKNIIEAAANGTSQGLSLALQIGAMLIAFISIIYLLNDVVGLSGFTGFTLERLMGYALAPVAFLIGIPLNESVEVGQLLGIKTIFTEFLSYLQLKTHIVNETLSPRTIAITTYALCGFTHFGSIAILIGGIGTLVPEKKPVVSRLAIKALVGGFLATMMTAAIAGLLM
ncbi:MAG: NupC/NupG family nucleoside CNT transporter [Candidatus Aminicenantes bacterium]|nr:MAG: NupC/NupG family nucleoside CNT transporter [Candidatus Aminicenantes bacterium]